jgi:PAS domain S-box-containing protein
MSKDDHGPEDALTSSEQELRLLVETIPTLVWRAAPDGNFDYVNKRTLEYLGAPLSEVIGWGWMDKVHPDDVGFKVRSWLQNLESGKPHDVVCRILGADGRYRWFEVRGEPSRASDGRVLNWYGVLIDIDDRRKAEDALRDSEYKLRQIIETVPSLLWSLGPSGEQTQLSQRALDYIGVRFEELLDLGGWTKFIHPDDLPETTNAFHHSIQTGTSYQAVHRIRRADGEYRWHHARGEPLRDRQGRVTQWYGLTVDIDDGKRAEDRLRRSEAYLAEAQRLSHTGSFGWTPATGELHWSDETFRILEYDPSVKPTIEGVLQRIHPDDRAMTRQLLDETSHGEKNFDNTHRLLMPDGSVKFVHVLSRALKDAAGNLEIVGAVMDVTENTCLYDDLAKREAKIRRLVDANIIGVFIGDLDGRILEANDAFLRIVGYDCEDVMTGRINWKDLTPPDWRDRDAQWIKEHEQAGVRLPIEKEYFRSDGSRVPVLVGAANFEGANQGVAFVLDLTERKKAEEQLRLSEARLAEAQRLSHSGVAAYDEKTILYGSEETYRIWGFDPAQGVPSREAVNQRIHPDDRDRVLAEVQRAVGERRDYSIEYRILLPDGTAKHLESIGRPVFSASGKLIEIVVTHLDVTERKRAQEEHERLRQLESDLAHINRVSMMGELAASLAHEITQPIATARNNARAALNFLNKQPPDLGEVREALGCVVGDADRAGVIIDQMRDHIKKAPPRKHRFDLNEAINEVIVLARSATAENGISVQTRLSEGLAPVEGDRVQLQQVILNLVLNAAEAMSTVDGETRQLVISTEQDGANGVLAAVRDSGPGINPELIERVFEAFYTTKHSGVGMGLSICRSIIEAHDGRLWVDANEPRGAAFQFTLPGAEGLMNSLHVVRQRGAPHEDSA